MSKKSKIILAKEMKLTFQILGFAFLIAFAITSIYAKFKISELENSKEESINNKTKNFNLKKLDYPNQSNLKLCYENDCISPSHNSSHYHTQLYVQLRNPTDFRFRDFRGNDNFVQVSSIISASDDYEARIPIQYAEGGNFLDYLYFRKKTARDISNDLSKSLSETKKHYNKRIQDVRNEYEFSFEAYHIGSSLFWKIFFLGFAIIVIRYIIIIASWVETTSQEKIEDD